jgi:hypothetical protein
MSDEYRIVKHQGLYYFARIIDSSWTIADFFGNKGRIKSLQAKLKKAMRLPVIVADGMFISVNDTEPPLRQPSDPMKYLEQVSAFHMDGKRYVIFVDNSPESA